MAQSAFRPCLQLLLLLPLLLLLAWSGPLRADEAVPDATLAERIEALRDTQPGSPALLELLLRQAAELREQDRTPEAYAVMQEAVALERSLGRAGDSAAHTSHLLRLAELARSQGQLDDAMQLAAEIGARLQHAGSDEIRIGQQADLLQLRAGLAISRGQWLAARDVLQQALQFAADHDRSALYRLRVLNNLGYVARETGDLAAALQALDGADLLLQDDGSTLDRAVVLHNRGQVHWARADLGAARDDFEAAAQLERQVNPTGLLHGATQLALGATYAALGEPVRAARAFERALAIHQAQPPGCRCVAGPLLDLGYFELRRGQPDQARTLFRRAWQLAAAEGESTSVAAAALRGEADAELAAGRPAVARPLLRRALRLEADATPDSHARALSEYGLGRAEQALGRPRAARAHFCAAAATLDRIRLPHADSTLAQARFRARYDLIWRECLHAELQLGRQGAAFETLERARARGFVNALQARALSYADPARAAALLQPRQPALTLQQARAALPPAALALSYVVDDDQVIVFALSSRALRVVRLPLAAAQLAARVAALRRLIEARDPAALERLQAQSAALYELLLQPLAAELDAATLLLVGPDGALHDLPFAALWERRHGRWLVERMPLALLDSLSARALLASRAAAGGTDTLLAVGDPLLSAPAAGSASSVRGAALPPLPGALAEVRALPALFPGRSTVLTGRAATESQFKATAGSAGVLHLAVHAVLDRHSPLDSALLLRGDGTEDGRLQVAEVLQQLRLQSTLVVLSGCETGAGTEYAGEGLLGFSRAFRFAGSAAVVASLWPVADAPTTRFMTAYYRARGPAGEARALRQAALALLRSGTQAAAGEPERGVGGLVGSPAASASARLAHPYYWAAFQLYGE